MPRAMSENGGSSLVVIRQRRSAQRSLTESAYTDSSVLTDAALDVGIYLFESPYKES